MRKWFGMSLVLSSALLAMSANASADCASFIESSIFRGRGYAYFELSFMAMQGSGLITAKTPYYPIAADPYDGRPRGADSVEWRPERTYSPYSFWAGGEVLYSVSFDRGRAGNPFAINAAGSAKVVLETNGVVHIRSVSVGPGGPFDTTLIDVNFQAECLNNVLYGWGRPIGQLDGPKTVLYVISTRDTP